MTLAPTAPPSPTLRRYQRLQHSRLGRWRFERAAGRSMPLLPALQARFDELRIGLCRASMPAHRRVRTLAGELDPIAVGALTQLAAGMLIEISVPSGLLWSARGLTIEHLRATRSGVSALARLDKTDWAQTGLVGVPVTVSDAAGTEIARAVVSFALSMQFDSR
jgi:hypothetical protein